MNLINAMRSSANGMAAERFRMDVISANIANANSQQTPTESAYRRREVVLSGGDEGPRIEQVIQDQTPFNHFEDRSNPNADPKTGQVTTSNVKPVVEMVDMISASRAYEANISAFNAAKGMMKDALNIGKV